ncbi:uncharacterized protein LOC136088779 [Hydra vulgaris]|uniref:Uncharacterized protein LOC136088779 n=1 Tax=Hydra vulgaris TaxID=6087 RepID=A0ABM4D5H3_HYDVU
MANKKKHSGFFYRKRKSDTEREDKKQAQALSKFFSILEKQDVNDNQHQFQEQKMLEENPQSQVLKDIPVEAVESFSLRERLYYQPSTSTSSSPSSLKNSGAEENAVTSSLSWDSLEDCGMWPARITDDIRQLLVVKGPVQVKYINFLLTVVQADGLQLSITKLSCQMEKTLTGIG